MFRLFVFTICALGSIFSFAKSEKEKSASQLNFLELNGYFRTRMDLLSRCDLGTYVPPGALAPGSPGQGTSNCPVPTAYTGGDQDGKKGTDRPETIFSSNMRLRLEPTMNVTEDIRVLAQVDILDNVVLGNAPGLFRSLSYPYSFLTSTLYPAPSGPIAVKRAWAEIDTPVGEIRFGRMPINWGLGVLYHSGNDITNDYGDNVDGVMFATQAWGLYFIPGFFVSYVGSVQRQGGLGSLGDGGTPVQDQVWGQRYNTDPSDDAYTLFFSVAKKDKPVDIEAMLQDKQTIFNYGAMASYRFQLNEQIGNQLQKRDSHAGFLSLWGDFFWEKLHIEGEAVGVVGQIGDSKGLWLEDPNKSNSISILQAGIALKSRYGFMEDRLGVGLDAGWASGDKAYGMGTRPGANPNAVKKGDADGRQFVGDDTTLNNFRFNPDYRIDMILFREVLGTITDAFYIKPHIGYDFSRSLGMRLDVVSSFANFKESTPGQSHALGLEFDGSIYYKSDRGIFFMAQYGLLIPFAGLDHSRDQLENAQLYSDFGTSRLASAFQVFGGVEF